MYKVGKFLERLERNNTFNESLKHLFYIFDRSEKKYELYLVGGCVRDLLLGVEPKDYDLCTNATPDEMKEVFARYNKLSLTFHAYERYNIIETGIKHGTLTIHDRDYNNFFEITTYRIDGKYEDARHPESVTFTPSLEEDLKRRDFTINSFAYNLLNHDLVMLDESYLNDLSHGIIRAVGNAQERFEEDALRMLRAIRFSAQKNFIIDSDTYDAIKVVGPKLAQISKERIRDELTKIILSDNPQALEMLITTDIEQYLFDGNTFLKQMVECKQQNPWHYTDVFHHTIDVIKRLPKKYNLRWSALFHDAGKSSVEKLKEGTDDCYVHHGHPEVSCEIAENIMNILKFSNDSKDLILKFVKYHDAHLVEYKNSRFKNFLVDIGLENFDDYMKLRMSDAYAHRLTNDMKYAVYYLNDLWKRYDSVIINNDALTLKDLKVNGVDMYNLGLRKKEIGTMLNFLLEEVLNNPKLNDREVLLELAKHKISVDF